MSAAPHIVWFSDLDTESEHFGRHTKHHAKLTQAKFPMIPGFVITTHAYYDFLKENNLEHKINQLLSTTGFELADSVMQTEFHIKKLFRNARLSNTFIEDLLSFYIRLGPEVLIELHETGTHGKKHHKISLSAEDKLTEEVLTLWAEMFSGKALWYRHHQRINHFKNGAEITVHKKILGDKTGTVFTIDPMSHARDKIFIHREHTHNGDHYLLSKKNLVILDRAIKHTATTDRLTFEEILDIAKIAKQLDEHLYFPQKIKWMIKGNKLYISDIKPITDFAKQNTQAQAPRKLPIARGKGLTALIGTGVTTIIQSQITPTHLNTHDIVVVSNLNQNQLKNLKKIRGIIMEDHPHAKTAAMLKHLGVPAICNVKHATKRLRNGHILTIHGGKGEIYRGGLLN